MSVETGGIPQEVAQADLAVENGLMGEADAGSVVENNSSPNSLSEIDLQLFAEKAPQSVDLKTFLATTDFPLTEEQKGQLGEIFQDVISGDEDLKEAYDDEKVHQSIDRTLSKIVSTLNKDISDREKLALFENSIAQIVTTVFSGEELVFARPEFEAEVMAPIKEFLRTRGEKIMTSNSDSEKETKESERERPASQREKTPAREFNAQEYQGNLESLSRRITELEGPNFSDLEVLERIDEMDSALNGMIAELNVVKDALLMSDPEKSDQARKLLFDAREVGTRLDKIKKTSLEAYDPDVSELEKLIAEYKQPTKRIDKVASGIKKINELIKQISVKIDDIDDDQQKSRLRDLLDRKFLDPAREISQKLIDTYSKASPQEKKLLDEQGNFLSLDDAFTSAYLDSSYFSNKDAGLSESFKELKESCLSKISIEYLDGIYDNQAEKSQRLKAMIEFVGAERIAKNGGTIDQYVQTLKQESGSTNQQKINFLLALKNEVQATGKKVEGIVQVLYDLGDIGWYSNKIVSLSTGVLSGEENLYGGGKGVLDSPEFGTLAWQINALHFNNHPAVNMDYQSYDLQTMKCKDMGRVQQVETELYRLIVQPDPPADEKRFSVNGSAFFKKDSMGEAIDYLFAHNINGVADLFKYDTDEAKEFYKRIIKFKCARDNIATRAADVFYGRDVAARKEQAGGETEEVHLVSKLIYKMAKYNLDVTGGILQFTTFDQLKQNLSSENAGLEKINLDKSLIKKAWQTLKDLETSIQLYLEYQFDQIGKREGKFDLNEIKYPFQHLFDAWPPIDDMMNITEIRNGMPTPYDYFGGRGAFKVIMDEAKKVQLPGTTGSSFVESIGKLTSQFSIIMGYLGFLGTHPDEEKMVSRKNHTNWLAISALKKIIAFGMMSIDGAYDPDNTENNEYRNKFEFIFDELKSKLVGSSDTRIDLDSIKGEDGSALKKTYLREILPFMDKNKYKWFRIKTSPFVWGGRYEADPEKVKKGVYWERAMAEAPFLLPSWIRERVINDSYTGRDLLDLQAIEPKAPIKNYEDKS